MKLTAKQEEGLKIAVARYKNNEPYTCIAGYAGSGKAQPINIIIPTPDGYRKLGELKVGDYVFDRLGKPTKVLGVYPQGEREIYTVTLSDGRTTKCASDHLWSYYTELGNLISKTTSQMLDTGITNKSGYKYKIPNNRAVEYPKKQYKIDPYMLGVFLGDGCCKERYLTLSSETDEIPNIIGRIIEAKPIKNSDKNYNWTFEWNNQVKMIKWSNCNRTEPRRKPKTSDYFSQYQNYIMTEAYNKDIPPEYKFGSIEQRLELIRGLMDTDGSISKTDNYRYKMRLTSTSEKLLRSVQEILYSLGYSSSLSQDKRENKYTFSCYTLNINIPNEEKYKFFKMKRKLQVAEEAKVHLKRRDYSKISIVDIQKTNEKTKMVCIYVDNEEHLYLTENYIVTHNTTLIQYIIEALDISPLDVCYVAYTGKSAQVLRSKNCPNAITAHRLLYTVVEQTDGTFIFIPKTEIDNWELIVVDEVSMIPKDMWELLLSHGIHIIACGDPFQLPPVSADACGILDHPHIFLDEIVRQAAENEIIRLTMDIRAGKRLQLMKSSQIKIVNRTELLKEGIYFWADQVICGRNNTRRDINLKMHYSLMETTKSEPLVGDKIICLHNEWDCSNANGDALVNGLSGVIEEISYSRKNPFMDKTPIISFVPDIAEPKPFLKLESDYAIFTKGTPTVNKETYSKIPRKYRPKQFDYGYAITGWKAQGSEWDKVLVIDEKLYKMTEEEHNKFLYTCATRAKEKLIIVKEGY